MCTETLGVNIHLQYNTLLTNSSANVLTTDADTRLLTQKQLLDNWASILYVPLMFYLML